MNEPREARLVLQPVQMHDAFLLVPEEHIENPREFLRAAYEAAANPTAPVMTLRTIWNLIKAKWRGETLPDKLPL